MFRIPTLFPADIDLTAGGAAVVSEIMDQSLLDGDIGVMSVQWTRGGAGACVLTVEGSNHKGADTAPDAAGVVWTTVHTITMTDTSGGQVLSRPPYRYVRMRLTPAAGAASADVNVHPCWP